MAVKKCISLPNDLYENYAKKVVEDLFGGNFSAYVVNLISKEREKEKKKEKN